MKKSALSLVLGSLLFTGACTNVTASDQVMEKNISVNVQLENNQGGEIKVNLDGTEYNVQLSQQAVENKEVRQSEVAHLPSEVQKIVHDVFNKDQGFEFSEIADGDKVQVIKKVIQHDGDGAKHKIIVKTDGDENVEWVGEGDADVVMISDLSEHHSLHGDRQVMVIKTEFDANGDKSIADLIVSLIQSKPLTEAEKEKIRAALNQ